jgi:adenosylmethionine-8-amino-7-oxononanoate aminotransferase
MTPKLTIEKAPPWLTEGFAHIWLPYTQMQTTAMPEAVVGAQGCRLKLADGRELIDGTASWWSMCHGYQHPHIVAAIQKQAGALSHVMFGGLAHEPAYRLATRLCKTAGMGMQRAFFAESGSVAVEVALKMALQYWRNKGEPKRNKFICFSNGYHGDTVGAMSVSARSHFNAAYDSLTLRNYTLDIPTDEYSFAEFSDTIAAIKGNVAALIIEPLVQAAGGFRIHSADILSEIRRVCREHGILFIADEIATGFARTGSMFACHEASIEPDILCVGKALSGGHMPLAATLTSAAVYEAFLGTEYEKALMHGPTFMAHPIACAAANASLDLFEREPRMAQVEALEQKLWEGLRPFKQKSDVVDVRIKGAIGVIEMQSDAENNQRLRQEFIARGVWLRPFGHALYLMPSLTISDTELETIFEAIDAVLG